MLIGRKESTARNARRERRLLQDELRCHESLQCPRCPDRQWCGGLKIGVASMSCLDLCCGGKDSCDVVCRRRLASYVEHVREIDGFDLSNVVRTPVLGALQLPSVVPIFYHGTARATGYSGGAVCLPFFEVIAKDGHLNCPDDAALRRRFRLAADVPVILSATAKDQFIEAWWSSGARPKERGHPRLARSRRFVGDDAEL